MKFKCAFIINGTSVTLSVLTLVSIIGVIVQLWIAMVIKRAGDEFI